MTLRILSSFAFTPNIEPCENTDCHRLHPKPNCIQIISYYIDLILGISLITVAILAANNIVSLSQEGIYVLLGIGFFEITPVLGHLLWSLDHSLHHWKLERAKIHHSN